MQKRTCNKCVPIVPIEPYSRAAELALPTGAQKPVPLSPSWLKTKTGKSIELIENGLHPKDCSFMVRKEVFLHCFVKLSPC